MFTGQVESLAFGGAGVIRHDSKVVFVPFTLPGETVSFRITQDKKNFAYGTLEQVLQPSGGRVTPLCPSFGTCGGCQLQHMAYPLQLEAKRKGVEEALVRIGKLSLDFPISIVPADPHWHYRRHVQLHIRYREKQLEIGYVGLDNASLVGVKECPIFVEKGSGFFPALYQLLLRLMDCDAQGRITAFKTAEETFLLEITSQVLVKRSVKRSLEEALATCPLWQGIVYRDPEQRVRVGSEDLFWEWKGKKFQMSARAFAQNHPQQSAAIYQSLLDWAEAASPSCLFDLYCGIGVMSALLQQKGIKVVGVEASAEALQCARLNAPFVSFHEARVEQVLDSLLASQKPQAVLMNPPRGGLDAKVVHALLKATSVEKMAYISCMPSTLARDLKNLGERFEVEGCTAYDMFPQTSHVETVAFLKQKKAF